VNPLNLHPKVLGAAAGTLATTIAEALFVQCGGASGILATIAPIVVPLLPPAIGSLVAYYIPTGTWKPAPTK
jgi:hypothetical protein